MIRSLLFVFLFSSGIISCTIDEEVIPIVGVYRAHVFGVAGPFDLIVSTKRDDNLLIEAPFDGENWEIIEVDVDDKGKRVMDIDIVNQELSQGIRITGDGFFSENTLELNYTMTIAGTKNHYKIVASKR